MKDVLQEINSRGILKVLEANMHQEKSDSVSGKDFVDNTMFAELLFLSGLDLRFGEETLWKV